MSVPSTFSFPRASRPLKLAVGLALAARLVLGGCQPSHAEPAESRHATAVRAALNAQVEAWNRSDLAAYLGFYEQTEGLTCVSGGQILHGFTALQKRFTEHYGAKGVVLGKLRFDDVEVSDLGFGFALSLSRFHLEREGQPAIDGAVSLVWHKGEEGYRIVSDHRSIVAAAQGQGEASKGSVAAGASRTLPGGLIVEDLKVGEGETALQAQWVRVHYTGWLTNGTKFDSSLDRRQPFEFQLGQRMVIRGWDEGVLGMRVGGKRRLTIPASMAYGKRGAGDVIPPDATLIFEVELLGFGRPR